MPLCSREYVRIADDFGINNIFSAISASTHFISMGARINIQKNISVRENDALLFDNKPKMSVKISKDTEIDEDIRSGLATYFGSTLSGQDRIFIGPIENPATNESTCIGAMLVSIQINKWLSKYYNYDPNLKIQGSSIFNQNFR